MVRRGRQTMFGQNTIKVHQRYDVQVSDTTMSPPIQMLETKYFTKHN